MGGTAGHPVRTAGPRDRPGEKPVWWVATAAALLLLALFLLALGRHQWFFLDEYDFLVDRRADSLDDLLRPHNEHPSLLPVLQYRAIFHLVGMTSYVPYYAALVATHLTTVLLAVLVMRRHHVPMVLAGPAGVLLAVQAVGSQNVLWAFQTGFVGSITFFLGALLLLSGGLSTHRQVGVAALLVASLACSGVGLSACAGVAAGLLARREGMRALAVCLAPPAALYLLWYAAYGTAASSPASGLTTAQALDRSPLFVLRAAAHSLGGLLTGDRGAGDGLGIVLVVLLVSLTTVVLVRPHGVPPVPTAALTMAVALFSSTALVRVGLDPELARAGRYAYAGAVLLVVAATTLLAAGPRLLQRTATPVLAAALLLALPLNLLALRERAAGEAAYETALQTRVEAAAALLAGGSPVLPDAPVDARLAPGFSNEDLVELEQRQAVDAAREASPAAVGAAQTQLRTDLVGPVSPPLPQGTGSLRLVRSVGFEQRKAPRGCVAGAAPPGQNGFFVFAFDSSGEALVQADTAATIRLYVGDRPDYENRGFIDRAVVPGSPYSLRFAAGSGTGESFLRIEAADALTVCSAGP